MITREEQDKYSHRGLYSMCEELISNCNGASSALTYEEEEALTLYLRKRLLIWKEGEGAKFSESLRALVVTAVAERERIRKEQNTVHKRVIVQTTTRDPKGDCLSYRVATYDMARDFTLSESTVIDPYVREHGSSEIGDGVTSVLTIKGTILRGK